MTEQQNTLHNLIEFEKKTLAVYMQLAETAQKVLETDTPHFYEYGYQSEQGEAPELSVWLMPKSQSPHERVVELKKMVVTLVNKVKAAPRWISAMERLPEKSNYYHVKGKRCGFFVYFDAEKNQFEFPEDVAVNHITENFLEWLEE